MKTEVFNQITITTIPVGPIETNCYLVANKETKKGFLIDPGAQADRILDAAKTQGVTITKIFLTHGHFDHIMAINQLKEKIKVEVLIGKDEDELLREPSLNCSAEVGHPYMVAADVLLHDCQKIDFEGTEMEVIFTPGHTGGGVCYHIPEEKVLFSGDTLFQCSIGRSDLPTGSGATLVRSIKNRLTMLHDDTKVYPGHGPATSIGYEKKYNPYM